MTKITEYTLDISKWRCGGDRFDHLHSNVLGEGNTKMLNDEGYMCCLGQFALQAGVPTTALSWGARNPANVQASLRLYNIRDPYDDNFVEKCAGGRGVPGFMSSDLASDLMDINDSEQTTPLDKVHHISMKLAEHNIKLNVLDPNNQLDAFK